MARSHAPVRPSLSVALATCNGAAYLPEQLTSLLAQTLPPTEIVICDDHSTDATLTIIQAFAKTSPIPIRLHRNPQRLGVVQNFAKALSLCRGDYLALCDQDDVWLPDRLALTAQALQDLEARHGTVTPLLVSTDATVTDAALRPIHPSLLALNSIPGWLRQLLPRLTLIFSNTVTGHTVLCNRALLTRALPIPATALMHDHWLALVAAFHGHYLALPQTTVLYRQHGRNQVGVGSAAPALQRLYRSIGAKLVQARAAARR